MHSLVTSFIKTMSCRGKHHISKKSMNLIEIHTRNSPAIYLWLSMLQWSKIRIILKHFHKEFNVKPCPWVS
jgi:hypothetical protein